MKTNHKIFLSIGIIILLIILFNWDKIFGGKKMRDGGSAQRGIACRPHCGIGFYCNTIEGICEPESEHEKLGCVPPKRDAGKITCPPGKKFNGKMCC